MSSRERILGATERLLTERDLADIPLNEICIEADVSSSSLYHRFPSKQELAEALYERFTNRATDDLAERFMAIAHSKSSRSLLALWGVRYYAAFLAEHEGYLRSMINLERQYPSLQRLRIESRTVAVDGLFSAVLSSLHIDADSPEAFRLEFVARVVAAALQADQTHQGFAAMHLDRDRLEWELAALLCREVGWHPPPERLDQLDQLDQLDSDGRSLP